MNVEAWRQWISGKQMLSTNASAESKEPLQVAFDSRLLASPLSTPTLFIAIDGLWHDGHDFIEDAHSAGVRFFLVKEGATLPELPDSDILAVADVIQAWQSMAFQWRSRWGKPVIAIAGSNGKTTVKEWLASLLTGRACSQQSTQLQQPNWRSGIALGSKRRSCGGTH